MAYGPTRQGGAIRKDPRFGASQVEELNQRLLRIPQHYAAEQDQKLVDAKLKNLEYEREVMKKQAQVSEKEERTALGLEVLKTGMPLVKSFGDKKLFGGGDSARTNVSGASTAGYSGTKVGGPFSVTGKTQMPMGPASFTADSPRFGGRQAYGGASLAVEPRQTSKGGAMWGDLKSSLSWGNTLGAGLIGFGAGGLAGGFMKKKNKWLSAGIGAGAGLLSSWMGGSQGWGLASGGFFGGLGGLASALI